MTPHRTQKLYLATADFALPNRQPVTLPPATAILDIADYVDAKIAAFKAHTSQAPLFPVLESNIRQRGGSEMFHLAASMMAGPITQETDLFRGVEKG
jgi:LmbE family N-acetylglucosaminyl deacetylase